MVSPLSWELFHVAATIDPINTGDTPSASSFSIGAGVWWTLSGIIASFAGGYAAGRLSGRPKESTAGWHGLTSWAVATLLIFYLLTSSLGGILGGAYRTVTNALGGVAQTVGSTAQTAAQVAAPNLSRITDPFSLIEQSVRNTLGGNDPAVLRDAVVSALRAALAGDEAQKQDARERAAQAIARAPSSCTVSCSTCYPKACTRFVTTASGTQLGATLVAGCPQP